LDRFELENSNEPFAGVIKDKDCLYGTASHFGVYS
jgi:hypothetical protein